MTDSSNNQQPLPPGYEFQDEKLRVERVLGIGGFGITYLVRDLHVDDYRVLKENFPKNLSLRASGSVVSLVSSNNQDDYDYLLKRFIFESEQLQRFAGHPNIANVVGSFRANNTAYMLMSYRPGKTLAEHIQQNDNRPLSEDEIKLLCLPVLKGLQAMHAANLLHLDIKPENIYIPSLGEPYLIDFGGARHFSSTESQRLSQYSSMVRTPGYAPPEQSSTQKQHQAATDLYAFGATLYYAISSQVPIDANDRRAAIDDDEADPLSLALDIGAGRYSPELLQAIDACLRIKRKDRPQSVAALLQLLPASWQVIQPQTPDPEAESNSAPDNQSAPPDSESETKVESNPKSQDTQYNLAISLEQAAFGDTIKLQLPDTANCPDCVNSANSGTSEDCSTCSGKGVIATGHKTIAAKIPAGVDTGDRIRLRGEGYLNGDLYLVIEVKEHAVFERQNSDLICDLPVPQEIIDKGGQIEAPILSGKILLKIPESTQPGKILRVAGKGLRSLQNEDIGSIYYKLKLESQSEYNGNKVDSGVGENHAKQQGNQHHDDSGQIRSNDIHQRIDGIYKKTTMRVTEEEVSTFIKDFSYLIAFLGGLLFFVLALIDIVERFDAKDIANDITQFMFYSFVAVIILPIWFAYILRAATFALPLILPLYIGYAFYHSVIIIPYIPDAFSPYIAAILGFFIAGRASFALTPILVFFIFTRLGFYILHILTHFSIAENFVNEHLMWANRKAERRNQSEEEGKRIDYKMKVYLPLFALAVLGGWWYLNYATLERELKELRPANTYAVRFIGSSHSDYTKLDKNGMDLASSARSWACVRDNRSGLVWEVKTDDGGIHDKDRQYRWGGKSVSQTMLGWIDNSPDNRFSESRWNGKGKRFGDWDRLIDEANAEKFCGFSDWRVPDIYELATLVRCFGSDVEHNNLNKGCLDDSYSKVGDLEGLTINVNYFPNTLNAGYWSSSASSDFKILSGFNFPFAYSTSFSSGRSQENRRTETNHVRLVRADW